MKKEREKDPRAKMYRSAQRIRAEAERAILMSRDSFSARCHRRTNRKGLYWNCQTVRISIRMLVGERNGIERENERNRKQTVRLKREAERGRDAAIFFAKFFRPQVTFDIDANGILSVSAVEKSMNKENKITITNDKGCLSREDIERMVNEAERYHAEDEKQRERVAAKNNLESYSFNMKSTTEEEKVEKKIPETDRKCINEKCNKIIKCMDIYTLATKEEFEAKLKEIEKLFLHFLLDSVYL